MSSRQRRPTNDTELPQKEIMHDFRADPISYFHTISTGWRPASARMVPRSIQPERREESWKRSSPGRESHSQKWVFGSDNAAAF